MVNRNRKTCPVRIQLLIVLSLLFSPLVLGKSRRPITDIETKQKKAQCYADIESGLWGWQCKSTMIAKENCVLKCLSPTCYELVYESDPLEEGEKDLFRGQEFKYCMHKPGPEWSSSSGCLRPQIVRGPKLGLGCVLPVVRCRRTPSTQTDVLKSNKLQSPLVQNRQDKLNRQSLCLKRHHEAAEEDDFLDQENSHLVDVDVAPNKQLSDLIEKETTTSSKAVRRWPFGIVSGIRRLSIDGNSSTQKGEDVDVGRIFLPESISVRSNDYVKLPPMTAALTPNAAGLQIAADGWRRAGRGPRFCCSPQV